MNLTSSIVNPITFKYLDGGQPNAWNTLHAYRRHGRYLVIPYCQKVHSGSAITLQFSSTVATVPTLVAYNSLTAATVETIAGTLESTLGTDDIRYYFNYVITFDSDYLKKEVYFLLTQGADVLTSEPVYADDYTNDLANGEMLKIEYTNLDRLSSDLPSFYVDWSQFTSMFFFVEGSLRELSDSDEVEILENSQSKEVISSVLFAGVQLKTGIIPDYMCRRLEAVSSLDVFTVNGIDFVKESGVENEIAGGSTSFQSTIKMIEKAAIGINVDDLGISETDKTEYQMTEEQEEVTTDTDFDVASGYYAHTLFVVNPVTSATATITASFTNGGDDIINAAVGVIPADGEVYPFVIHNAKSLTGCKLYVGVSGVGASLTIILETLKLA